VGIAARGAQEFGLAGAAVGAGFAVAVGFSAAVARGGSRGLSGAALTANALPLPHSASWALA
jgi:hypothetical protein